MASSVSTDIFSSLYNVYMLIAAIVGALVVGWLFYNMWKFRALPDSERPPDAPIPGTRTVERGHPIMAWIMAFIIAAILFGLAFSTINAIKTIEEPPKSEEAVHLNVTGFQFGWRVAYTGEGGVPFEKINDWTVPVDTPVIAQVHSQDVWHNFAIPEYRVRIDAIPGETTHIWWRATEEAEVKPVCVQICGVGHALMKATMHVVSADEYATWVTEQSDNEFAKIERRGNDRNVTLAGGALSVSDDNVTLPAGTGVMFRLVNEESSATEFIVSTTEGDQRRFNVPAGETSRVYLETPDDGDVVVTANGQTAAFEVVTQ